MIIIQPLLTKSIINHHFEPSITKCPNLDFAASQGSDTPALRIFMPWPCGDPIMVCKSYRYTSTGALRTSYSWWLAITALAGGVIKILDPPLDPPTSRDLINLVAATCCTALVSQSQLRLYIYIYNWLVAITPSWKIFVNQINHLLIHWGKYNCTCQSNHLSQIHQFGAPKKLPRMMLGISQVSCVDSW